MSDIGVPIREHEIEQPLIPEEFEHREVEEREEVKEEELIPVEV